MAAGPGDVVFAAHQGALGEAVGEGVLPDEVDDIAAKAGHAPGEPEVHDLFHRLDDGGVSIVEVRLALGKEVQIKLFAHLVILPGAAAEEAGPVVGGRLPLPSFQM